MPSLKYFSRSRVIALTVSTVLALAPSLACAQAVTAANPDPQRIVQSKDTTTRARITLTVDFVVMVHIGGDIGTILLGNSGIADATLTDGKMIILKGVGPGVTNVIVLDTAGAKLAEFVVQVSDRKPGTVTVRRAMEVQSYVCLTGICESNDSTSNSFGGSYSGSPSGSYSGSPSGSSSATLPSIAATPPAAN